MLKIARETLMPENIWGWLKFWRFYDLQNMHNILFIKFALRGEISVQKSPASPQLALKSEYEKMKTLNVALLPMQYRSNLISELSYLVNLCLFWNLNLLWIVRHSPYIYCNFYPQDGATVWNLGLKETSHWEAMLFVSSEGESWCDQLKCLQNVKKVTYPEATSKLLTFLLQVG